ncbi:MAG: hypothetical protein ACT4PJ_01180 [Gemmatimonadaceae bacterium]
MNPRRLVSLALSFSLLFLSSTRADSACAGYFDHSAPAVPAHHASADDAGHAQHGPATESDDLCDIPSVPECCPAFAACSITMSGHDAVQSDDPHVPHGSVTAALAPAPISRVTPPEPPPPRL